MTALPILVVDDETLIRLDLVDVLESSGYAVCDRGDGPGAVAELDRRDRLCGLVTDINLGSGRTGWEIARYARKKFPKIAIVYITGDSAADWPSEGVPHSVVIQKPFAQAQILAAIAAAQRRANAQ